MRVSRTAFTTTLLALAGIGTAAAHTGQGIAGGFVAGFSHPFGGLDHLLAIISVGIWGAFLGKPLIWQLPIAFPFMMVVGGALGIAAVPIPYVEIGIAISVLVLGCAIAAGWRAPRALALAIIAVFAICHGYAHGQELPQAANAGAYATGFVIATGLLHVFGIVIGLAASSPGGAVIVRAAGIAIAIMGGWFLLAGLGYVGEPPDLPPII